jgi:putative heme-binding domain-containing protein
MFMANIHEHAVLSDVLVPKGSGFSAQHADDFVLANNAQWIGFSMEIGPGGNLYVLDWHDADICGKSVMQKETGRIFRISPQKSQAESWKRRYQDLSSFTDEDLALLQTSKSDWHARRARLILQARAVHGKISGESTRILNDLFEGNENPDFRLRALWALHVTGALTETKLLSLLRDHDPYVRAWSVQLLCEDLAPSSATLKQFSEMAKGEPSPVVRMYLAAALQRMAEASRWEIVEGLMSHGADAEDHNIPKMIWFGFESLVAKNPKRALELVKKSEIPLVTQFTARRAVDGDALEIVVTAVGEKSKNQVNLLLGLGDGLEGRTDLSPPTNWDGIYRKLSADKQTAEYALAIAQQFGDIEAVNRNMSILDDTKADMEDRKSAIKGLAGQQHSELQNKLPDLWEVQEFRIEAIRALAAYNNRELGVALLERYPEFNSEEKLQVVQTMASRPAYGNLLTTSLKEGSIPKRDIPAYVARQLRRVVGNGFVETWGPIDELSIDREAEYTRYGALITQNALVSASLVNGKAVFQKACGACHQMYGEGGTLGPDLTGSNRENLDYILTNILDPNGDIQDDYRMVIITTTDGRTYAGNVSGENDRQVTLKVVGQDQVVINTSNIQSRETAPKSMMPEGLLQTMTDQEVIDLIAYLQTQEPLP